MGGWFCKFPSKLNLSILTLNRTLSNSLFEIAAAGYPSFRSRVTGHMLNFQSKSKGGKIKNPQTAKIFPNPLTPYLTITYPFSVFSFFLCGECFFDQNAPVHPIMGRFYIPILSEIKFNETKNLSAAPYGGLASA
jgi:hypothetical protein